jgi:hypothetical protein
MTTRRLFIIAGVSFSTSVSSPAMFCRNKNIKCNVIANRLPQSLSFPRMLKGDVAISSLETETTFITSLEGTKQSQHWEIATKTPLMFFLNKKHLHPGFSRNDDAAFVRYCKGVLQYIIGFSPWPVSPPAMLCRNKNIKCNRSTIHNVISRNEVISTLEIATKTPLAFFLNKKHLSSGVFSQ